MALFLEGGSPFWVVVPLPAEGVSPAGRPGPVGGEVKLLLVVAGVQGGWGPGTPGGNVARPGPA